MARLREDPDVRMARLLRRATLALLTLVALGLLALWRADSPRLERLRLGLADSAAPTLHAAAAPLRAAGALATGLRERAALAAENDGLRRELLAMRGWREAAARLERENARLRALNHLRLPPRIGFAAGEVVIESGGPFARSALLDLGAEDGVEDGAAVVDGAGVVGRVVGVGRRTARVLLLTDPSSRVPVRAFETGRRAILVGDGGADPTLAFAGDGGFALGERIVTSGEGGVLPPGLAVGLVGAAGARAARVRLAADLSDLDFVRVLRWRREAPPEGPARLVAPPLAAASAAP